MAIHTYKAWADHHFDPERLERDIERRMKELRSRGVSDGFFR